jgi:glutamate N-acetyltransferase/amino-acid N-acetyltransferase
MTFTLSPDAHISWPLGFSSSGVSAGLKSGGALDMALLYCHVPAVAAAAFTSNMFAAAPVQWSRQLMSQAQSLRAVISNSGNANACTGERGLQNARRMAELSAELLGIKPEEVLVCSTGRIGVPLPMTKIEQGIAKAAAALSPQGGVEAARAIMTTDTRPKYLGLTLEIGGKQLRLAAMVKGAGMIAPQMRSAQPQATMLAYVTTDANIEKEAFGSSLESAMQASFNRIIVDGDTSTNDSLIALASGLAGNPLIRKDSPDWHCFNQALTFLLTGLAKELLLDGEGVTHFVELQVSGTRTEAEARRIAEAIARSPLCKTAWFGGDPNWGRILCAAGYSGVSFDPSKVDLDYGELPIVRQGMEAGSCEEEQAKLLKQRDLVVKLKLGEEQAAFTLWTCDLSYDYVKINADYRT